MTWASVLLILLVCHAVGDVLLQTDWQATHKAGGLTRPGSRRALLSHIGIYTLTFIPALIWIAEDDGAVRAIAVALVIVITHLVIDDGRPLSLWVRRIKHAREPTLGLVIAVDQVLHLLCLCLAATIAAPHV